MLEHKVADSNRSEAAKMSRVQTLCAELEAARSSAQTEKDVSNQLRKALAQAEADAAAALASVASSDMKCQQLEQAAATAETERLTQAELANSRIRELMLETDRAVEARRHAELEMLQGAATVRRLQVSPLPRTLAEVIIGNRLKVVLLCTG